MTRRKNRCTKTVRVNRIERLETRQMLTADGLSCDDFHEDFAAELARSASSMEALRGSEFDYRDAERIRDSQRGGDSARNRGGRRFGGDLTFRLDGNDFDLRKHDRFRSSFGEDHRGQGDRQFGRESRLYEPQVNVPAADLSSAEGELVVNSGLTYVSIPIPRTSPASAQSSITSSRITFVIFFPVASSNSSPDSTANRSASNTLARPQTVPTPPRTAAEAESPGMSSIIEDSRQSQEADPKPTPSAEIANQVTDESTVQRTDPVQLVSFRPTSDPFARSTAIDASPEDLNAAVAKSASIDFLFDVSRFDDASLDRLLEQSKSLEDNFTELEELLDEIALERLESPQYRDRASASWMPADEQVDGFAQPTSKSVSDGMILILPGASLAQPTTQLVAQAFELPEDSAISQWTVGVGFYRALEVVGDMRFADALIAAEISIDPVNTSAEQNEIADAFAWQSDSVSSSRQAAGLVFCCLGIQYLRKRRRERDPNAVTSRLGNPPGEGTLD